MPMLFRVDGSNNNNNRAADSLLAHRVFHARTHACVNTKTTTAGKEKKKKNKRRNMYTYRIHPHASACVVRVDRSGIILPTPFRLFHKFQPRLFFPLLFHSASPFRYHISIPIYSLPLWHSLIGKRQKRFRSVHCHWSGLAWWTHAILFASLLLCECIATTHDDMYIHALCRHASSPADATA